MLRRIRNRFTAFRTAQAYREVFETPAGRQVLADLLEFAPVYRRAFEPGFPDVSAYHEGQRVIVLHILRMAGLSHAEVEQMAQQMESEQEQHEHARYNA